MNRGRPGGAFGPDRDDCRESEVVPQDPAKYEHECSHRMSSRSFHACVTRVYDVRLRGVASANNVTRYPEQTECVVSTSLYECNEI